MAKNLGTLEEVLFDEVPDTVIYSDKEEYDDAKKIFKVSEIGKEFSGTSYWKEWLKPLLENNFKYASQSLIDYDGLDKDKRDKLINEKNMAKYAYELIVGNIEDAVSFPRPIFRKQ